MMIRSRCTVQWTSENLCHRWHGRCLYPEMPRVIGGLLGSRWARQESSGAVPILNINMCIVTICKKVYPRGTSFWHAHFEICDYYASNLCHILFIFEDFVRFPRRRESEPVRSRNFNFREHLTWNGGSEFIGPISSFKPSVDEVWYLLLLILLDYWFNRGERRVIQRDRVIERHLDRLGPGRMLGVIRSVAYEEDDDYYEDQEFFHEEYDEFYEGDEVFYRGDEVYYQDVEYSRQVVEYIYERVEYR
ncbi:hypothetical protein DTO006G1_5977 [Penicillium roqueforti]|nr:hypothetical protein CBS147337_2377 [Penicillium roqueforti]KAI2678181.1 hypothetical protein CBS147355_5182 [Penicillium roqueforti]KAI2759065.1 hypothetical protein DTO006G1_5977 [Penicillium roqueforti]KAI3116318.1 hypothetical protein CBS147333_928 [Penicillium roqueforti]KAI3145476.1 hypothetical protein CBS147326_426 [Penicillium roqueforti]